MLRFLIGLGALYAAFQIGREFGRTEAEVIQIHPTIGVRRLETGQSSASGPRGLVAPSSLRYLRDIGASKPVLRVPKILQGRYLPRN